MARGIVESPEPAWQEGLLGRIGAARLEHAVRLIDRFWPRGDVVEHEELHNRIERAVRERKGGSVADHDLDAARVHIPGPARGVVEHAPRALDHDGIDVEGHEPGTRESLLDKECAYARAAPDLKHRGAVRELE